MKGILIVVVLLGLGYYVIFHHSPFQTKVTDPHYVEIRLIIHDHDIQMVGVGKMNSYEDCQARSMLVWVNSLKHLGEVNVNSECKKTLPKKYLKLFDNEKASATYIAFDKGQGGERDGRFLIYGVPSSHVYKACEEIIQKAKHSYSGKVYCIQGTVG
ncbi:MAG: hypothetical protein P8103_08120 [Candidatus Thiodiazotropha sp.]